MSNMSWAKDASLYTHYESYDSAMQKARAEDEHRYQQARRVEAKRAADAHRRQQMDAQMRYASQSAVKLQEKRDKRLLLCGM